MTSRAVRGYLVPALLFASTVVLLAQDWKTATALPGVDFAGLSPALKQRALHAVRDMDCTCNCGMKVAECRVKDPKCSYSKGLSANIIDGMRKGKSETQAVADAKTADLARHPGSKILEDPVAIPTAGAPVTGPADAKITLVEFSDFQCPYCYKAADKLNAILKAYPKDVRLIFKQFPLEIHSQAQISAQAALAAHQQGKFWQLHDMMFANRNALTRPNILGWAGGLGIDMKKFEAAMDSPEVKKLITRDVADGDKAGVEGTPTVFINGQHYNGELDLGSIKPILDAELKRVSSSKK